MSYQYGERSPDGHYWWDGTVWQPMTVAPAQTPEASAPTWPGGKAIGVIILVLVVLIVGLVGAVAGSSRKPDASVITVRPGSPTYYTGVPHDMPTPRNVTPTLLPDPTPTPTSPPPPTTHAVLTVQGSGDKTTGNFHISADSWLITYKVTSGNCAFAGLYVFAYPQGETGSYAGNGDKSGCGEDSTTVHAGPGNFYLRIGSANAQWTIWITEVS